MMSNSFLQKRAKTPLEALLRQVHLVSTYFVPHIESGEGGPKFVGFSGNALEYWATVEVPEGSSGLIFKLRKEAARLFRSALRKPDFGINRCAAASDPVEALTELIAAKVRYRLS